MPIKLACQCGQRFTAPDKLAGKTVKCPKCGQPLKIPTPQVESAAAGGLHDLLDDAGLKHSTAVRCPSCGAEMAADAILCVQCGYNQQTGKRLRTLGEGGEEVVGAGGYSSEAEKMLAKAERELKASPLKQDEGFGSASAAWLLAIGLSTVVGGLIIGGIFFFDYMEGGTVLGEGDGDGVSLGGGGALLAVLRAAAGLGGLLSLVGYVRILIVAFQDEVWHGLLAFFCGIYALVYGIMHWSECNGGLLTWLAGFLIQMVATGVMVAVIVANAT